MKKYIFYFEFFGRKMRISIDAKSEEEAKKQLFDKIIFHKTEVKDITDLEIENIINNLKEFLK